MDSSDFLAHYGIKGMKWGVVRKRGPGGRVDNSKPVGRTEKSSEHIRSRELAADKVRTLSNKELQDVITRMNLEQQYTRLSPSKFDKGRNAIIKMGNGSLTKKANKVHKFVTSDRAKVVGSKAKSSADYLNTVRKTRDSDLGLQIMDFIDLGR